MSRQCWRLSIPRDSLLAFSRWPLAVSAISRWEYRLFTYVARHSIWDLRSFGILLRSVEWHFRTDVWGQPISPILNGQAVLDCSWTAWPLKMETISCHALSVWKCHSTLRKIPKERRSHLSAEGRNQTIQFAEHPLPAQRRSCVLVLYSSLAHSSKLQYPSEQRFEYWPAYCSGCQATCICTTSTAILEQHPQIGHIIITPIRNTLLLHVPLAKKNHSA